MLFLSHKIVKNFEKWGKKDSYLFQGIIRHCLINFSGSSNFIGLRPSFSLAELFCNSINCKKLTVMEMSFVGGDANTKGLLTPQRLVFHLQQIPFSTPGGLWGRLLSLLNQLEHHTGPSTN